jgi:prepilin peptidase dependent protein B
MLNIAFHCITRRQRGVSLIELMVGMTVGLLIIAAAGSTYLSTAVRGRDALNSAKLNISLRSSMDIMVDEIRRAGFNGQGRRPNPHMNRDPANFSDLAVANAGACIEFAYDMQPAGAPDGELSTAAPFEYSGFRVVNGVLSIRNGGAGVVNACANGSWEPLTDSNLVTIVPYTVAGAAQPYFSVSYQCLNSNTNVSDTSPCTAGGTVFSAASLLPRVDLIETRTVTINMGARITGDNTMRMQLSQQVLVRNHRTVVVGT